MTRILKLLARLYPSSWRKRYGAEYEALLEDVALKPLDSVDVTWGAMKMHLGSFVFLRVVLPWSMAGMLAGASIWFLQPELYSSQKVITVMTTKESTQDLEVQASDRIFDRNSLASTIQNEGLYANQRTRVPLDDVVGMMRKNIHFRTVPANPKNSSDVFEGLPLLPLKHGTLEPISIVVEFDYTDPHVAQRVDKWLAAHFLTGGRITEQDPVVINHPGWTAQDMNSFIRGGATLSPNPLGAKLWQLIALGMSSDRTRS